MSVQDRKQGERKTRRAIIKILKTQGALDSAQIANQLNLTAMAVRQHLYALKTEGHVEAEERPVPIGRPAKHWRLTRDADQFFPEAYAELNVSLIDALRDTFGEDGLEKVLGSRCARQRAEYAKRISPTDSLDKKLKELARIRSEEGYMAEVKKDKNGSYLLLENHCPICAAANACQGFCSTELDLFRSILGQGVSVEREEHIVSGDRRCAYRVTPKIEKSRVARGR